MPRTVSASLIVLLLVATSFTALGARAIAPVVDLPQLGSGVGETWVVGLQTIDHATMSVADRLRVLPGAKLVVEGSTLTFADDPGSGTGLVAEPGSIVELRNSTLQAGDPAKAGTFTVNLQGMITIVNTTVADPAEVVLGPRPVTDHVAQLAPAPLSGQVLGEATLAAELAPGVDAQGLTVLHARGTAVVLAAPPESERVHLDQFLGPAAKGTLRLDALRVLQGRGPGVECMATDEQPGLGGPAPVLGGGTPRIVLTNITLADNAGGALWCPAQPVARPLPARVVPVAGVPVPAPPGLAPQPAVLPFGGELSLADGALRGPGTGLDFDAPGAAIVQRASLAGFATGLEVHAGSVQAHGIHVQAQLGVRARGGELDVDGSALDAATGARADGGALGIADSTLTGPAQGVGLDARAPGATLGNVTMRGLGTGVEASAPFTLRDSTLAQVQLGAALRGTAGTIAGTTFLGGALGVLLDHSTGATLQDNAFLGTGDPLQVRTDSVPVHAHFEHTVTGNTVDGRALSYVLDARNRTIREPVGHVVAAFSADVRWADVDLAHGAVHATASSELVIASRTSRQDALLGALLPAAQGAFDRMGQVRFKPYPGSLLGAQAVLDAGYANDLDAARALAEQWRGQGLTVRFVEGTQAGPTGAFLNWTGMRDPRFAFAMQGLRGVQWFGDTYALTRTWLEVRAQPGVWVEADPSYQQYAWSTPMDVQATAHVSTMDLGTDAAQGASLDYATHSAQNVNTSALHAAMSSDNGNMTAAINATGSLTGAQLAFVATPRAVLPGEDVARTPLSRFADPGPEQDWRVRIVTSEPGVSPDSELDFQGPLRELYGKRISIESAPDSSAEYQKARAAGSLYNLTPGAINYTTYLMVDGNIADVIGGTKVILANGTTEWQLLDDAHRPVIHHPGDLIDLKVSILQPGGQVYQTHDSPFRVGGTYAVVLDLAGTPQALVDRHVQRFQATLRAWAYGDANTTVSQSDLVGELVELQGLDYFSRQHVMGTIAASQAQVVEVPLASVAMTGTSMVPVGTPNGTRITVTPPYFDIRNMDFTYPMDGNVSRLASYNLAAGVLGSALEDKVFTEMYGLRAVSTIKVLTEANLQGVRLYHINASEPEGLSHLNLPGTVLDSIRNAVNNGKDVVVPEHQVAYYNWSGVGWIEYDTGTGSAAWLIYGGTAPLHGESVVAPVIQRGGAGAEYGPGSNKEFPDWGYSFTDKNGLDWTIYGVGSLSDAAEKGLKYSNLNDAANFGRRFWDGVGLNNDNRALLGKLDVPGQYGAYFGKAGNAATIVGQGYDMWKILNDGQPADVQVAQVVGVTAVNVATVLVGEEAIVGGAELGAVAGAFIGDGPGAVIGAVIGGVGAAFGLGFLADNIKGIFFGL